RRTASIRCSYREEPSQLQRTRIGRRIEVRFSHSNTGIIDAKQREDTMVEQDFHFYLRLNADEFPYIAHESWLVSGAAYRGRYVEAAGSMRRRVRLYHPKDERRTVV